MAELTTKQVVRALERLNRGWPEHLRLYSWAGSLVLVDTRVDPHLINDMVVTSRSVVPADTERILNEGGDPEDLDNGSYDDWLEEQDNDR